jgi:hypothetical protein
MPVDANRALVRRYTEDGFSVGNMAIFDETFAPDYLDHHSLRKGDLASRATARVAPTFLLSN